MPDAVDNVSSKGKKLPVLSSIVQRAHTWRLTCVNSTAPISAEQLSPAQLFVIGNLEDTRVEYKALNVFPSLKKTWTVFLKIADEEPEHITITVLEHIEHLLINLFVL